MAQHPDITPGMLSVAAPCAEAIHRRYIEGGGSESDWITDFSHFLAAVQHRVIDLDRRIPTPRPYNGPDRRASAPRSRSGL